MSKQTQRFCNQFRKTTLQKNVRLVLWLRLKRVSLRFLVSLKHHFIAERRWSEWVFVQSLNEDELDGSLLKDSLPMNQKAHNKPASKRSATLSLSTGKGTAKTCYKYMKVHRILRPISLVSGAWQKPASFSRGTTNGHWATVPLVLGI